MHARFSVPRASHRRTADTTAELPVQESSRRRHSPLRLILAGVGAFLVATALLLLFYVGPQLIAAPVSFDQTDILKATNASYFNAGTLKMKQGADLTYKLTIRSDPSASSHTNAVWNSSAVLTDPANNATVNVVVQRAAFNRRTGELLNCCGASLNGDTRIRQNGIGLFWPIGTQKITYQVFDPNSGHAYPATYAGTATVGGITTYRFDQHVPPTVAAQIAGMPSSLLGMPKSAPSVVVADRYWQADNIYWVDPRTGVVVNEEVKGLSVLRGPGGQGKLVAADLDLRMTPATQHQLTALASKNATSITMLRVIGPISTGVLGLILIAVAAIPFRRRAARPAQDGPEPAHDGLAMVTGSMHAADGSPARSAVASESGEASPADGAVAAENKDGSPVNGAKPHKGDGASPAAATTTRESEDRQD